MRRPKTFRSQDAFRDWLKAHHDTHTELYVRLFKKHAAHRGLTYAQALDEALCFGWIDGVTHRCDEASYSVRFTPRKRTSVWSRINVAHVARLMREKKMAPPGLAAFEARTDRRTGVYSFEQRSVALPPAFVRTFKANPTAWAHFEARPPGYQRLCRYWVMSAKKDETRLRRLGVLIASSAKGAPIPPLAALQRPGRGKGR